MMTMMGRSDTTAAGSVGYIMRVRNPTEMNWPSYWILGALINKD